MIAVQRSVHCRVTARWLCSVERVAGSVTSRSTIRCQDTDQVLIHQWIAFNSLYGQWDEVALEPASDRRCWQAFLGRVISLDRAGHLLSLLQDHKPLVLCILEDEYLNQYFWQDPCEKTAGQARNGPRSQQTATSM